MNELAHIEFADNPDPRVPCLLLLDTSYSMAGAPIDALNAGLQTFKQDVMKDALARRRVEVAIVSFGRDGVRGVQDFTTVDEFTPPHLQVGGATPMGEAMAKGLDILRMRKNLYNTNGVQYYRPWVFLITDGAPTDEWQTSAHHIHQEEARGGLNFFCIGVEGASMDTLGQIASPNRPPLKLKGLQFNEFFVWLSQSQQRVSHSNVGDQISMPSPGGWSTIDI